MLYASYLMQLTFTKQKDNELLVNCYFLLFFVCASNSLIINTCYKSIPPFLNIHGEVLKWPNCYTRWIQLRADSNRRPIGTQWPAFIALATATACPPTFSSCTYFSVLLSTVLLFIVFDESEVAVWLHYVSRCFTVKLVLLFVYVGLSCLFIKCENFSWRVL